LNEVVVLLNPFDYLKALLWLIMLLDYPSSYFILPIVSFMGPFFGIIFLMASILEVVI